MELRVRREFMVNAFNYMLEDKGFKKKFIGVFILSFISSFVPLLANALTNNGKPSSMFMLCCSILNFIALSIYVGYMFSLIKTISKNRVVTDLPSVRPWNNFVIMLKFLVASLLFMIVLCVVSIPLLMISKVLATVVLAVVGLIYIVYTPALYVIFSYKESFSILFEIGTAIRLASKDTLQYLKNLFLMFVFGLLGGALSYVLTMMAGKNLVSVFIISILLSIWGAYMMYVSSYLIARSVHGDYI